MANSNTLATTADLGIAIRDYLDDQTFSTEDGDGEAYVMSIDVDDPHNPIVMTSAGTFKLTITRID